ncbi:DUF1559 family PulG-like putative transporter [Planctopirus hydrillae]|uniref:DUF1559 domain-containing protein n=1 Tax=Planctopirus hydrillae TaxID=1841610 RepID=A0A1C3E5L5_9PLAN|nr:DUF1559 domain-containing protein [Planctopirus hydrillae]ODA28493.1 hypothetical protein A6X21_12310 [Planctopirus hydrillae]
MPLLSFVIARLNPIGSSGHTIQRSCFWGWRLSLLAMLSLITGSVLAADPLPEAKYLPEKSVAIASIKVSQLYHWKPVQLAKELGAFDEADFGPLPFTIEDFSKIDRIVVALDQNFINAIANDFGLETPLSGAATQYAPDPHNNLLNISLAAHNYHEQNGRFPRANGDGEGRQTGLSWRVHLLPYLDENTLYKQFRLNEPWDSEHNKKLISKMPHFYKSPGVKVTGKTSIHVITGPGTIFPDDAKRGTAMGDISDGTANTIMAVQADPSTAVEWTKPGGLPFDPKNPKGSLGPIPEAGLYIVLADASVKKLSAKVSGKDLAAFITPSGGEPVDMEVFGKSRPNFRLLPTVVISPTVVINLKEPFEMSRIEAFFDEKLTVGRHTIYCTRGVGLWPTTPYAPTTFVLGSIADLEARLKGNTITTIKPSPLVAQLDPGADFSMVVSLQAQKPLLKQLVGQMQQLQELLDYQVLTQSLRLTNLNPGDKILVSTGTCVSAKVAATKAAELKNQMQLVQTLLPALATDIPNADDQKMLTSLAKGLKVEQVGNKITTSLVAPQGIERLPDYFDPAIRQAVAAANATKQRNHLKQIGLAFHISHDNFGFFPSSSRTTNPDDSKALSWRVHILPFVGEHELYNQFHLNEPWDSPHNLKLAEKMPIVYKTPGVTEANKTSVHLLEGAGLPFDAANAPRLRDFTDGLSNTVIVVQAGADKADIWTKPGGLPIDPEEPLKSLGQISEKGILALNGDGSLRMIPASVDTKTLLNLLRHNDGK